MSKYLIIFGAGASIGSEKANMPPTTNKLFDELAKFAPSFFGMISSEDAVLFKEDFELGTSSFSNKYPHKLPILHRVIAEYFFNFYPTKESLYVKLGKKIKDSKWKGSLVTLNYERLLELSLISNGITPVIGIEKRNDSEVELCLPHGTCHLFCESVRASANGVSFSGTGVSTSGPVKAIPNPYEYKKRITEDAFPPVMSYFEPLKRTTSGVNFIESQRERLLELIKNAEIICLIGIKVRPHDIHIWDALSRSTAKIVYCSGETSGKDYLNWAKENRKNNSDTIIPKYFDEAFQELCSQVEL